MFSHRLPFLSGLMLVSLMAGCGGGGESLPPANGADTPLTDINPSSARAVSVAAVSAGSGSTVTVRARGTPAGGVSPTMVVRANHMILGSVSVDAVGTFQDYQFTNTFLRLGAGDNVDVAFVNDGVTEVNGVRTEDRNLIVDSITVDGGVPLPANGSGVTVDRGAGDAAFDGVDTLPGQSGLWWNAALRFVLPAPVGGTHRVAVVARATLAGGVGAQMVMRVGGQLVGSTNVTNVGSSQAYEFALGSAPAAGTPIDVAFVNDGVTVINGVRTEDRNLYVESVAVDGGTPMKPTDAGVTLDRGSGAAAFDGVDVIPGQVAIAWNGALRFKAPAITPPPPPQHTLKLRARATPLAGVGAAVTLRVAGQAVGNALVNAVGSAQDYVFTTPLAIPPGSLVDVVYTNDGASATEARDLYIESLTLDAGKPMLPTDLGVHYDKGDGAAAFDGVNVFPGQVILPWNGAMRFPIDGQPIERTLTVRARGVKAGGVAPQMQIWVDGAAVYDSYTSSSLFTVQSASVEAYSFNVSLRPGSRVDLVFVNPGSSTDASGTTQRALVIESVAVGGGAPMAPTAPGVVFDAGATHANVEAAAWRDGLDLRPGLSTLTEGGALRFSLSRLAADSSVAGGAVASMSSTQKIAATRMAYATVAAAQAQRTSLNLDFPDAVTARAPWVAYATRTIPPPATLCPTGGSYSPSLNGAPLAIGAPYPNAGLLQIDWSACTGAGASAQGTSVSELLYRTNDPGLSPPDASVTLYRMVADTRFLPDFRWTDARLANGLSGLRLPLLDLTLAGSVFTTSRSTTQSFGRFANGDEWFRHDDLLVTDRTHGTQARLRGHWLIHSQSSYGTSAQSTAVPLGLQFTMDGATYDVAGIFLMAQSSSTTGKWTLVDLTVRRDGAFVGHLSSWGSGLSLEVDGQRLPW